MGQQRQASSMTLKQSQPSVLAEPAASRPLIWGLRLPASLSGLQHSSSLSSDWRAAYWEQQVSACRAYDIASCTFKVVLLLGNVRRSLEHGQMHAAWCAGGAALLVSLSVLLMLLYQAQFVKHRRLVLWSHLVAISVMMATSMPQFLSTTSSRLWGHRALVLLFKMGVTWPMMAALMHRLPWEDIAVLCGAFCMWLCVTWAGPLCTHLHSNPADAALITLVAGMLDRVAGLGMEMPAGGALTASSSAVLGFAGSQASAGAAGVHDNVWEPLAHHITAACGSASAATSTSAFGGNSINSSSSVLSAVDCESLVMGQCQAVVATFTLWVGVLVILFWVVLAEQHSKWRWWHSVNAHWQGRIPSVFAATTAGAFLSMRLLYLHVLLDVPLIVLWVGTSSWLRQPTLALGSYNLW